MYTKYWGLQRRPFDNNDDARFYYPGETHQATLLKLHYAIENHRGAALLSGMAGLGKSLLVGSLLQDLADEYRPRIHVRFPQMGPEQLVAYLASEVTGERIGNRPVDVELHRIETFLRDNAQAGRHGVVVIDEAHMLCGTETMETIRLLLNYQSSWTLLLVGQPALLPALERMPELEERLSVKCLLHRFTADESTAYISHRLLAAGASDVHNIFDAAALEMIHQIADGIPRRINRLADLALLIGFAEEQSVISAAHVETVADELVTAGPVTRRAA